MTMDAEITKAIEYSQRLLDASIEVVRGARAHYSIGLKVCYGAWTLHLNNTLGDYYWGRGRNNDQACSACCMVSPAIASPIPLTTGYIGQQQHDKRDFYFSCLSTGGVNWTQPDPVTEIFVWLSLSARDGSRFHFDAWHSSRQWAHI